MIYPSQHNISVGSTITKIEQVGFWRACWEGNSWWNDDSSILPGLLLVRLSWTDHLSTLLPAMPQGLFIFLAWHCSHHARTEEKKKLTTLEYLCFLLWRPPNSHRVTDREKCKTNHVGILASLFGWQMINKSGTMLHDGSQSQDPPHGNTWSLWMLLDGTFLAKTNVFVKIFFFLLLTEYWIA